MVKILRYVAMLTLFLAITSCSNNDDNITNPNKINSIDFGDTANAILLSSFELNGNSDLEGWQPWHPNDSISTFKYSFPSDIPPGGGNWSLQLSAIAYNSIGVDTTIELSRSDSLKNYILSFWAKGKGTVNFHLHESYRAYGGSTPINSTSWNIYCDTLFRNDVKLNNLSILITTSISDSLSKVLIDNIKVVVK